MIVTVRVPAAELQEDLRVLTVGDEVSSWLTFEEAERLVPPTHPLQAIRGTARPLSNWEGAELDRYPVQIDLEGGALYWDAPEPVEGVVEIAGAVFSNHIAAPADFPVTSGVVRRVRMEWQDFVLDPNGRGRVPSGEPRYEEIAASYCPSIDLRGGGTQTWWTWVLIDLELIGIAQAWT